jgi:L-ascorbate metabolism protein UlaG (beta-lactamase superfamily)
VGAGPTIGPPEAKEIATQLHARWIVPMHYRTPRIGFLEPADAFLDLYEKVERLATPAFDTADLPTEGPVVVVPAVP